MTSFKDEIDSYECVEPDLGEQTWRLAMSDLDPDLRRKLEEHVSICAACRLEMAMQSRLVEAIQNGSVTLPEETGRSRDRSLRGNLIHLVRPLQATAIAAIAACLALIFVLPPQPESENLLARGAAGMPYIQRPVPGEIVLDRHPFITWTPIENATRYRVNLQSVESDFSWEGEAVSSGLTVPDSVVVPASERLHVFVRPVPDYLGPPDGLSSSFEIGSLAGFVGFRLAAAPSHIWWFGVAGLLLLCVSVAGRMARCLKSRPAPQIH